MEAIEWNARARVRESFGVHTVRDNIQNRNTAWFKKRSLVPHEPIIVNSSEDIGTHRIRANHPDAVIDYFMEQEFLKKEKKPL
jgi:hypothetical protein